MIIDQGVFLIVNTAMEKLLTFPVCQPQVRQGNKLRQAVSRHQDDVFYRKAPFTGRCLLQGRRLLQKRCLLQKKCICQALLEILIAKQPLLDDSFSNAIRQAFFPIATTQGQAFDQFPCEDVQVFLAEILDTHQ